MRFEPSVVTARWRAGGEFIPRQFTWQGETYEVDSTGRQWEDENGLHVLCMLSDGRVFELLFRLDPAGWWVRPPTAGVRAA